jgi:hypothetical protein
MTSSNSPASVGLLPAELLLMIFRLVYHHAQNLHVNFYPYALASVCTAWRDAMSIVPTFWTHIIIQIDSGLFSLRDLKSHLNWSRDLLIRVCITYATDIFSTRELEENRRLESITALLSPHVHRCRTIHYDASTHLPFPLSPPMSMKGGLDADFRELAN